MTPIRFTVHGTAEAQPRPRFNPATKRAYNPSTARGWKMLVYAVAVNHRPESPMQGPLRLALDMYLPRPKALCRKRDPDGPVLMHKKPDIDNLFKAIADGLQSCGIWTDDAQIAECRATKWYHEKAGAPRVEVVIERMEVA